MISQTPHDRPNCLCLHLVADAKQKKPVPYVECPRVSGMRKFVIKCGNCNADIAFIHATDSKLTDWCNLHYTCEKQNDKWRGCFSVNISPFDLSLGFECACGQDTRDFRANNTLPPDVLKDKIKKTSKGREFGKKDSQFYVEEIKE